MASLGFPSLLQYSRLTASITDIKQRSTELRTELVTGRIADLSAELGGAVGDAQLLRKAIDEIDTKQTLISRALGRAQTAQVSLARATEGVTDTGVNIHNSVSRQDENGIRISAAQAKLQLEGAVSALNQRYEGRALFSGDAVENNPLADAGALLDDVRAIYAGASDAAQLEANLDAYFNASGGGFETDIYLGGAGNAARTEIADGELINYSAKADEQPFRDLLRNLASLVVAGESTGFGARNEALSNAAAGIINANNDISQIRARIGASEGRLADAQSRLEAEFTAFTDTYNQLTARDEFEAATQLQQLETQLQASFTLTARISRLTLVNFL